MTNENVVYTAIFGDYDNLIELNTKHSGCDYICFTDQKNITSETWEIIFVNSKSFSSNLMNRRYKLLPHLFLKKYTKSLYVDGNIAIIQNPLIIFEKYELGNNILMPKHFLRDCIYQEGLECMISRLTTIKKTLNQLKKYQKLNFPQNYGLGENNVLLREHNNKEVIKLMDEWWEEISTETARDQLSLGFLIWKNNLKFNYLTEGPRMNDFFELFPHKKLSDISYFNRFQVKLLRIFTSLYLRIDLRVKHKISKVT